MPPRRSGMHNNTRKLQLRDLIYVFNGKKDSNKTAMWWVRGKMIAIGVKFALNCTALYATLRVTRIARVFPTAHGEEVTRALIGTFHLPAIGEGIY